MTHTTRRRIGPVLIASLIGCSDAAGPEDTTPIDCSVFSDNSTSKYVLPFAVGQSSRVTKTFTHYTPLNGGVGLYAIDFALPLKTPVHAARAGRVVAIEQGFADFDIATFHENWVMVRHADATIGRYIHITPGGALVSVGDTVLQGQLIALSGASGTGAAHLHFDIQTCGPNLPPGYNTLPCGMTVPVNFRNTDRHLCGLEVQRTYTAAPFVAKQE